MPYEPRRTVVPASAHFPVGYNKACEWVKAQRVPASAHFPVGYNAMYRVLVQAAVPASAHFPVGYNFCTDSCACGVGSS